eukprot:5083869-Ditylum_brightwellii.AAC.1
MDAFGVEMKTGLVVPERKIVEGDGLKVPGRKMVVVEGLKKRMVEEGGPAVVGKEEEEEAAEAGGPFPNMLFSDLFSDLFLVDMAVALDHGMDLQMILYLDEA